MVPSQVGRIAPLYPSGVSSRAQEWEIDAAQESLGTRDELGSGKMVSTYLLLRTSIC